jgi:hypothetical protein
MTLTPQERQKNKVLDEVMEIFLPGKKRSFLLPETKINPNEEIG